MLGECTKMKKLQSILFLISFYNCQLSPIISVEEKPEGSFNLTPSIEDLQNLKTDSMIQSIVDEVSGVAFWLHRANLLVFLLSCIPSTAVAMIIWSYLKNLSLVNEGILLDLYKDVVANLIVIRIAMLVKGIIRVIRFSDQPTEMNSMQAKITFFIVFSISFSFFVQLNVISVVRLYIAKTRVLDPPMPRNDQKMGLTIIRTLVVISSIGIPSILYIFKVYPKIYYKFVTEETVPISSHLYSCFIIFLVIMFVITIIAERYYSKEAQDQMATIIPCQIYFILVPTILLNNELFEIILSAVAPAIREEIYELLTSISGIATSMIIVFSSKTLLNYATKFVKEKLEELFFRSIYVIPLLLLIFLNGLLAVVYWVLDV